MATEIEKVAERVAKLRAQAEKFAGPLAEAEAQLEAVREAEAARRAEREGEYNRHVVATWRDRADEAAHSGDDAHARFLEALSAEPWFAAYVEYRSARYKRGHVLTEAQRAQTALREVVTVPEQRWYEAEILDEIQRTVEKQAAALGAKFSEELDAQREAFVAEQD
ncbi:hypothetical protein ACFY9C_02560 [Streptomyces filamentosus]|uniref:hypothetical protein n=1 Tax=Streptomyces filamentosus TaxID=67294 RepID=UPI0033D1B347